MCKKWIFSFVLLFVMLGANAQFRKIPAEVTNSFKGKYSNAQSVSWKDKVSSFQADFKVGEKDMKATFSSKGEWLKTETKHTVEELPESVQEGFKKSKYAGLPIHEVTQIEEKEKGVLYKIIVKKNDVSKKTLVFTKEGQMKSDNGTL